VHKVVCSVFRHSADNCAGDEVVRQSLFLDRRIAVWVDEVLTLALRPLQMLATRPHGHPLEGIVWDWPCFGKVLTAA